MAGTPETHQLPALDGRTVVLTRSPDRAGTMCATLKATGAQVVLFPVIDFEVPADTSALDEALGRLASGAFDWLVVTSITTVRALAQRCVALGLSMAALVPERTQVAAVGETTRKALAAEGLGVDLMPGVERSGQGLLQAWPVTGEAVSVLLPQADIADPALGDGLRQRGADVVGLTAYHTVDYPADSWRRLDQSLLMASGPIPADETNTPVWAPQEFTAHQLAGGVDALVLTSPSAARRVSKECGPLDSRVKVVAIGRPTAREAERCGLGVSTVAAEPSGGGIAAALEQALNTLPES
ncbi:MAG TPA: uroporphyrinogen-III synthase [Arthrobacter sp.]|nr:uroporphyrinogen-III synthase [Arthrobacter sp.]